MAELPILPIFTDAYIGDTRHLNLEEHGAYLLLMLQHWRTLPHSLADDDRRIARMLGISTTRWRRLKPVICDGRLYAIRDQKLTQKRLEAEFTRALALKQKKRKAAEIRWQKSDAQPHPAAPPAASGGAAPAFADASLLQTGCMLPPDSSPDPNPNHSPATALPIGDSRAEPQSATDRTAAAKIIALFDAKLQSCCGITRPRAHASDPVVVQLWLADGISEAAIEKVISDYFDKPSSLAVDPPRTLRWFDRPVRLARTPTARVPATDPDVTAYCLANVSDAGCRKWLQVSCHLARQKGYVSWYRDLVLATEKPQFHAASKTVKNWIEHRSGDQLQHLWGAPIQVQVDPDALGQAAVAAHRLTETIS